MTSFWVVSTSCSSWPAPAASSASPDDETDPWVQIRRRIGRGHQVVLRDALGRPQITRRAASRAEALEIAAALTGDPAAEP